ncbi:MAG: hypothetical protein IJT12_08225 [Paludibacteraceae bacterium]|nr:hypothetical protein [Paludibacteraceae bacterium]
MKKSLFFAIALVASVLAFTSCDGNNAANPLQGTWVYQTDPAPDSGWYGVYTLIIKDGKNFRFTDEAHAPGESEAHDMMVMEGEYETKDDILTLHYQKHGWIHGDQEEFIPDWEGYDEQIKYTLEGKKLTLIRNFQEGDNSFTEIYTKK